MAAGWRGGKSLALFADLAGQGPLSNQDAQAPGSRQELGQHNFLLGDNVAPLIPAPLARPLPKGLAQAQGPS